MAQLDAKDDFDELTAKQQAIVETKAKHPDLKPTELAEQASEGLPAGETVSRSYVKPILENYGHIVEKRQMQLDNQRYEGETKTVGDPFDGELKPTEWQSISERETNDEFIVVRIWKRDVELLLQGEVSDELRDKVLSQLIQQAF